MNLVTQLEEVLDGKIKHTGGGICSNVEHETKKLRPYFFTWKHFSGDIIYPVPDPTGMRDPISVYMASTSMWSGEYGELRKDLVRHIISEVKKDNKFKYWLVKFSPLYWWIYCV